MGYDLSGKQVKDHADIEIMTIDLKAGDVTDPDTVRFIYLEMTLQEVLLFQKAFSLMMILLGMDGNTLQTHLPHQFGHVPE